MWAHLAAAGMRVLGAPVLGDIKYGNRKLNERTGKKSQELCAACVRFGQIPPENTLAYLSGREIALPQPEILRRFEALAAFRPARQRAKPGE